MNKQFLQEKFVGRKGKGQLQLKMMKRKFTSSKKEEKRHSLRFVLPLT
jgi:hypothetical protein